MPRKKSGKPNRGKPHAEASESPPSLPPLPPSIPRSYEPLQVDTPGWWLVLSDLHIPYHEEQAVQAAVEAGMDAGAVGVLLNGDILDYHELSDYDKDPTAPRYREERECGLAFFAYLRARFPKADTIYKAGNHEERLERYVMRRAPALFGLELISLPALMELDRFGVKWVGDKRVVRLGKLNVLHGHEYTDRQVASPVNPARGLFLKTKGNALCGHHHQTSEHHEPTITGRPQGCWSTGCLCQLCPQWKPLNKWGHGFALVRVDSGGGFHVRNLRILDGKVV